MLKSELTKMAWGGGTWKDREFNIVANYLCHGGVFIGVSVELNRSISTFFEGKWWKIKNGYNMQPSKNETGILLMNSTLCWLGHGVGSWNKGTLVSPIYNI